MSIIIVYVLSICRINFEKYEAPFGIEIVANQVDSPISLLNCLQRDHCDATLRHLNHNKCVFFPLNSHH